MPLVGLEPTISAGERPQTQALFTGSKYKQMFLFTLYIRLCINKNIVVFDWKLKLLVLFYFIYFFWRNGPKGATASSFLTFLDNTKRRTTVDGTPLDEWSARRRDLYLTTHNTHNRQTSMLPVGFEPTISAGERPQNYALGRVATGTGFLYIRPPKNLINSMQICNS